MHPGDSSEQLPEKDSATGRQAGKDYIMKNIEATKIAEALRSAGITDKVLKEALLGILAIKAVLLLLSLTGLSTALWFAALLDGFAAVGAVLNAVRAFPPEK